LAPSEVVCHNDPGPNNFVFRDDVPVGLIDFDMAAPGDPLDDLGYMAWAWCISSKRSRGTVAMQTEQVRTLADAYGMTFSDRQRLPSRILERQRRNIQFWEERRAEPDEHSTTRLKSSQVIEWSEREMRYTETHLQDFITALS
jgi:aminoglycoside phosphotransferase (APT) family kinase protein